MTNTIILLAVLISSALGIFLLNGFVHYKLKNRLSENEDPSTISYFKGVLFISSSLLFSELVLPFQTVTKILPSQFVEQDLMFQEIVFYCIFLFLISSVFVVVLWLSILLFSLVNKAQSIFIEVANNNCKSLVVFAAILLTLTFSVKTGITPLLDEFIPYPTVPLYR